MRSRFLVLSLVVLTACGCARVRIQNHPEPVYPALPGALIARMDAQCPPAEGGLRRCGADTELGAPIEAGGMGCDTVSLPDARLGALSPAHPLLVCEIWPHQHGDAMADVMQTLEAAGAYVLRGGGLWPRFTRYVVLDGDLRAIVDRAGMAATWAPVDSPEEALSYALAATGLNAFYGLVRDPALAYEVARLEDTHVLDEEGGYRVLLYDYQLFGCGPHWTDAVWVHVGEDGSVEELERVRAFRDPEEDGLCAD